MRRLSKVLLGTARKRNSVGVYFCPFNVLFRIRMGSFFGHTESDNGSKN